MVSLWGCCPSLQGGSHRCDKCAFPSVSILLSNYSHYIISTSPDHRRHRGLTPLLLPFIPYSCVFHRAGLRLFAWGLHRVLNDQSLSIQGSDTSPLLAGFGKLWLITGVERAQRIERRERPEEFSHSFFSCVVFLVIPTYYPQPKHGWSGPDILLASAWKPLDMALWPWCH